MTDLDAGRTDIMSAEARSRLMARIGGRNTKPEVTLRKALFRLGFRYRLHPRDLPGRPDMVFPRWRAVVFVHGCFWHGHGCHLFKWPKGNAEFWQVKIAGNMERDRRTLDALAGQGWRVLTVWECGLRGRGRLTPEAIAVQVARWIVTAEPAGTIQGPMLPRPQVAALNPTLVPNCETTSDELDAVLL